MFFSLKRACFDCWLTFTVGAVLRKSTNSALISSSSLNFSKPSVDN